MCSLVSVGSMKSVQKGPGLFFLEINKVWPFWQAKDDLFMCAIARVFDANLGPECLIKL